MELSSKNRSETNLCTIQYNTIQYNTIQYNTIQYNTIQYNTIQYNVFIYISEPLFLNILTRSSFTFLSSDANMLWFAVVPLLIASVVGYQCYKHVLHMALEQEQARARARASQYEGGSGSGSAVHVSASGTTFMPYNSNQLPSAEATLVSAGSPATYEMATAVVTTSKIV